MKKILFFCMSLLCLSAHAAAPTLMYSYNWPASGANSYTYSTGLAACQASAAAAGYTVPIYNGSTGCSALPPGKGEGNRAGIGVISSSQRCAGGTLPNTSLPLAQQCADPAPQCEAYRQSSVKVSQGTAIPGTNKSTDMHPPTNINGCSVLAGEVEKCTMNPTTKEVFCTWRVTETGAAKPSGESPTVPASPTADTQPTKVPEHNPAQGKGCPAGTVSLGIDSTGGSICGGSGTAAETPTKTETKTPPVTTTNPDGSTTKVESTTRTNSDGSTTTTTTTTVTGANGGTTVTQSTSTSQKPSGGSGTNDSTDDKKDDFCVKNPNLNVCKNSQVSGSCDDVACTGDAIQCAIYRSQQKSYCELNKENPSATLGNQAVAGNDPLKATLPTKENAAQVSMQSLDQAGFLGGGSCFQDKTFNIQGMTVSLPFSKVCPYIEWLRYVVMVIAALVSLKIVSKPVLGD